MQHKSEQGSTIQYRTRWYNAVQFTTMGYLHKVQYTLTAGWPGQEVS